ncbi:MAG: N-6 DNA methylase, partial [Planctomycetaceae bacterium]|nr:N-6 DNA methylase [Planctomycetaceae bacterium]
AALYELMRGFQAANDVRNGELLREVLANDPNHVYAGLLRVLMRLVFVMYAEDRDLLSSDPIYSNYYSVTGLFNRLREDAGRHPDTMNQRYGAWSQLLTLFRLIYEGGQHGDFRLPARKGYLFDPDRYPFLEGRSSSTDAAPIVPRVSDGVVYKVLRNLLILDGERLSYRTLDVEQIGSVYETVMGFNLEVARGRSIAIKPVKSHGAPATINLSELLKTPGKDRVKWLKEHSDQTLGKEAAKQLKEAESLEQLLEALDKKIAKKVTPRTVPKGAIVLQPSDERRRSGSHYTPRSLTEPIVRTTLEPILKQLCDPGAPLPEVYQPSKEDKRWYTQGEIDARIRLSERAIEQAKQARAVGTPHPSQILDLKICDPAMGSGAFLVEACRQLADELVKAWYAHQLVPTDIPPDEDEVLYARRQVAQRCLYGVDKNEMAVDLAKLSLWLVTLAKDHPFTFLDHSLRHGDSLVGLTRKQIIGFHWEPKKQKQFGEDLIQKRLDRATEARAKILNAREDVPYRDQEQRLALADEALNVVRMTGDACVSAFFAGKKAKEREKLCDELFLDVARHFQALKEDKFDVEARSRIANAAASLRTGPHPISPFHWEIEFSEVFSRANGGFDAFVGNPPFLGGSRVSTVLGSTFRDWILAIHDESHGNGDLVAHFFRRCFNLLRQMGCLGLIATNTIAQGDTRTTGLKWICKHGGEIYAARRRVPWPGVAAVVVSVLHLIRNRSLLSRSLDGRAVPMITAYLFHAGGHDDPSRLSPNLHKTYSGTKIYGAGFTFDDSDSSGLASPTKLMH